MNIQRQHARNQDCTLQIYGVCRHLPEYTVGCHMRMFGFAGMAQKPSDMFMIYACDRCHAVLDSRDKWADAQVGWDDVLHAFMKTLRLRMQDGMIEMKGEDK